MEAPFFIAYVHKFLGEIRDKVCYSRRLKISLLPCFLVLEIRKL